jgi:hypothetical protein
MGQSIIVLHAILPSAARTEEILAATSDRFGLGRITPDEHGRARLWMEMGGPEAFEAVTQALDASAPDWRDYVWLRQPEQ